MKVSLNPINTNTKSSNPNQVNFKARAELRLSEDFFVKLATLNPKDAAMRIQEIINAATFLQRVAPKIGKRDELVVLTEGFMTKPDQTVGLNMDIVNLDYYRRHVAHEKTNPLYRKEWIGPIFIDDPDGSTFWLKIFINENADKGMVLKDGKKLPIPTKPTAHHGGFAASTDGSDTLTRIKYDGAYTKQLREEKTTLQELMTKLRALCTPASKQKQLRFD